MWCQGGEDRHITDMLSCIRSFFASACHSLPENQTYCIPDHVINCRLPFHTQVLFLQVDNFKHQYGHLSYKQSESEKAITRLRQRTIVRFKSQKRRTRPLSDGSFQFSHEAQHHNVQIAVFKIKLCLQQSETCSSTVRVSAKR